MTVKKSFDNFMKVLYTFLFCFLIVNPHQDAYATQQIKISTLSEASNVARLIAQNFYGGNSTYNHLLETVFKDHSTYNHDPEKSYFLATNSDKLREIIDEIITNPTSFEVRIVNSQTRLYLSKVFNKDIGFDPYLKKQGGTGFTKQANLVVGITGVQNIDSIIKQRQGAFLTAYVGKI